MKLKDQIAAKRVDAGHVSCWWLGGSGFAIKSPAGAVVYVDPYLSDSVRSIFGTERAFPPPILPDEVRADAIISTHWHEDHLDPGSIPGIAQGNPDARFVMPPSATAHALSWGLNREHVVRLQHGQTFAISDVVIEATPARHDAAIPGWEVPDAMGVLLHIGDVLLYHCGDTEYDVRLRRLKTRKPTAAMLCINGVGGNMDAHEAALLAWHLGASVVIPIHHYLWATNSGLPDETLDPRLFASTYARLGGRGRAVLPELGVEIDISA
jgi:L-ascorbate metabolism protein UlaG (beta-lactamase superfamily)